MIFKNLSYTDYFILQRVIQWSITILMLPIVNMSTVLTYKRNNQYFLLCTIYLY